jgi:hypothetical protein
VPEALGVQELAAKGFRFWPDRLTCRGRRELPLKVWNISKDGLSGHRPSSSLIYPARNMPTQRKPSRNKGVPVNIFLVIRWKVFVEILRADRASIGFYAAGRLVPDYGGLLRRVERFKDW